MNEVLKVIEERSSTRGYTKEKLTDEELRIILTAGLQAPTARNEQEVHISVLEGDGTVAKEIEEERRAQLLADADEEQKEKIRNNPANFYYDAPTVLLLSVKKDFFWSRLDAGICAENIVLAAQSLGLGSLIIGCVRGALTGAKQDYFAKAAQFPENYEFAIAVALGHKNVKKEPHKIDFDKSVTYIR